MGHYSKKYLSLLKKNKDGFKILYTSLIEVLFPRKTNLLSCHVPLYLVKVLYKTFFHIVTNNRNI